MNKKVLTLCLVYDNARILLGMKKRGFGAGRWNGFGGKVQEGETVEAAAHRELAEEAGIRVPELTKRAVLEFLFEGDPMVLETHVFSASVFEGEPTESEEMRPQWFLHPEIPFQEMWADDRHWMPILLSGKNFMGRFLFSADHRLLEHDIHEV
ncbi:MAG: hypothetical protein A3C84_04470 [Candidatus Ryanbacteria bacterium RIFCSPHIGHO2_02_FULL_48_12]|uniref:Oxidized purine nucleoside triphosphate hydrolase n=1 Tax=Candidatus Ryanbacteria bacterium RIFCSPHIGHO2_01_FULL_48_27 TaxID=1802115 RepID=A0A1G2G6L8_9BACT|nr:MAG: hypothetical protein A2756_02330 [Candidatus Ryanbacteria bacterium RIFCSPHIGHO2_01_FULL_48_27]OGZ49834.1 MAG: hypothetical protein A3C84_04470 [Candidatus Ryanbacteria bacterium RIFCSPHIGHO2_02_FULL_48_12]